MFGVLVATLALSTIGAPLAAEALPAVPPTPTPTPPIESLCDSVSVDTSYIFSVEGNEVRCFAVDAPDECCWTSSVDDPGGLSFVTPRTQCGDHLVCIFIATCDCSTCSQTFYVSVADRRVAVRCQNYTPVPWTETPTPGPATPTATPTVVPAACPGDCNADRTVTVDELLDGVQIALGRASNGACAAFDSDYSGDVTVDELIQAINSALSGCPRLGDAFAPGRLVEHSPR